MNVQELKGHLKEASHDLAVAQEVIVQLAQQNQKLAHDNRALGLAVSLVESGRIVPGAVSEKVAELSESSEEDLVFEQRKLAEYDSMPGHSIDNRFGGGDSGTTSVLDFIR